MPRRSGAHDETVQKGDRSRADPRFHGARVPAEQLPDSGARSRADVAFGDRFRARRSRRTISAISRWPDRRAAAEREVHQDGGWYDRNHGAGDRITDLPFFQIADDALRCVESVRATAGEHDGVDSLDHVEWIEQIGFASAGW